MTSILIFLLAFVATAIVLWALYKIFVLLLKIFMIAVFVVAMIGLGTYVTQHRASIEHGFDRVLDTFGTTGLFERKNPGI